MRPITPLQILDGPNPEGDRGDQPPEREEEDGRIPAVERRANPVPHLLRVPPPWSRALGAAESRPLFLEVHPRALGPVVDVPAILAHPLPRPVEGRLRLLLGLLGLRLPFAEDGEGGGGGGGGGGGDEGWEREDSSRRRRRRWGYDGHATAGSDGGECDRGRREEADGGEDGEDALHGCGILSIGENDVGWMRKINERMMHGLSRRDDATTTSHEST